MIKQAIIPLAGLGTRLLPLTSVFAKELLQLIIKELNHLAKVYDQKESTDAIEFLNTQASKKNQAYRIIVRCRKKRTKSAL